MPVADYGESIEWDPSFNPAIDLQQPVAQDNEVTASAKWLAIKESQKKRQLHFHPNHRLQARNINKKKKARMEDAIYYR